MTDNKKPANQKHAALYPQRYERPLYRIALRDRAGRLTGEIYHYPALSDEQRAAIKAAMPEAIIRHARISPGAAIEVFIPQRDLPPPPLPQPPHANCPCGDNDGLWCSLPGCPYPRAQAPAFQQHDHALAARYQRLHSVCARILWTDLGVPAMESDQTKAALSELSEILLMDALISVSPLPTEGKDNG